MTLLQFFKNFFIDNPIAITKKIYFWLFNFIGVRFPILYIPFYYWNILRPLRIGKDGRVGMLQLSSDFVYGCNLRCEFCNAFSPYLKGFQLADALLSSYVQWSKKIKPQYFFLSGGEPFLHPELPRILRESAKIWKDSELWISTNGLLLERLKPDVLQAIKDTNYKIIVTEHTFEPEHRKRLDAGYARLKHENIYFVVRPSRLTWLAVYQYGENGSISPYKSNPTKAWNNCMYHACMTIADNKLFKCVALLHAYTASQKGVLDAEVWKAALIYQPLTLLSTPEEIIKHLRRGVGEECAVCPEKYAIVPARQMSLENVNMTLVKK